MGRSARSQILSSTQRQQQEEEEDEEEQEKEKEKEEEKRVSFRTSPGSGGEGRGRVRVRVYFFGPIRPRVGLGRWTATVISEAGEAAESGREEKVGSTVSSTRACATSPSSRCSRSEW